MLHRNATVTIPHRTFAPAKLCYACHKALKQFSHLHMAMARRRQARNRQWTLPHDHTQHQQTFTNCADMLYFYLKQSIICYLLTSRQNDFSSSILLIQKKKNLQVKDIISTPVVSQFKDNLATPPITKP
jgi:hypothetical protein